MEGISTTTGARAVEKAEQLVALAGARGVVHAGDVFAHADVQVADGGLLHAVPGQEILQIHLLLLASHHGQYQGDQEKQSQHAASFLYEFVHFFASVRRESASNAHPIIHAGTAFCNGAGRRKNLQRFRYAMDAHGAQ